MSDRIEERPAPAAPLPVAAAVVSAGILAAILLVELQPGLNWLLVAAALGVSVAVAWRRDLSVHGLVFGILSLGLAASALLTSTEWQLAVNLLAALGLACLATSPARSWIEVLLAAPAAVLRSPRAMTWLLRAKPEKRSWRSARKIAPWARGVTLGGFLLIAFGALFVSADQAFAHLAGRVLGAPDVSYKLLPARFVVAGVATAFAASLAGFAPSLDAGWPQPALTVQLRAAAEASARWRLGRIEWITALAMVNILFALFVVVQLAVLFEGREHVLETTGLTYAEYARSGFFQLAAAASLTLALLGLLGRLADRSRSGDEFLFKLLGGVLVVMTLVVLASALKRLTLYEAAYGFTRLRLVVHASILWLAGLFFITSLGAMRRRAAWVPRAVIAFSAVTLLAFSLVRPDALIARRNVERFERLGKIDVDLLRGLSPDAVPALAELPEPERSCSLAELRYELEQPESFWSFNLARSSAREVLADIPARTLALQNCPYN
jgi:hypothetical protein